MKKNKIIASMLVFVLSCGTLVGCTQSVRVTHNLSQEADNFNLIRRITVINCIQGDVLFQMTGRLSLQTDSTDNKIDVIVEVAKGQYQKHLIGLSDNVTYVIEQIEVAEVDNYAYTLSFNPKMWLPVKPGVID